MNSTTTAFPSPSRSARRPSAAAIAANGKGSPFGRSSKLRVAQFSRGRLPGPAARVVGFTLIEVIVAIAVLASLAAIAIPQFANYRHQAQIAQAVADIRKIDLALRIYKTQNGDWPSTLAALGMSDLPTDPWDRAYGYLKIEGDLLALANARKDVFHVPINSDFDLYSKGRDGSSLSLIPAPVSQDDIIRANDGRYVGLASEW